MNKKPSDAAVKAWISLWQAHREASSTVKDIVKKGNMPPIEWYDVLLELERGSKSSMRPYEIQEKLLFPQYGLSRLLAKLETEGLIQKHSCEEDGRGQVVQITQAGRDLRKSMWPVYGHGIYTAIGDKLSEKESHTLVKLLKKLCDGQ